MTTTATHHPSSRPRTPRRARRTARTVLGVLLLLPGLVLLTTGGAALWAHLIERSDGFVTSPLERFTADGHALVSDRIDLSSGAGWLSLLPDVGRARLEVTGTGTQEVFVGVAPAADVAEYLDGVRLAEIDGLGFDGSPDTDDQVGGGAPSGPPDDQDFWTARAAGTGTQEVTWDADDGDWVFVVMNADSSAGVDVHGRIGAEAPSLGWISWAVLVAGAVLTALGVQSIVRAIRRP